jgi:chromosome segregation ATPase
MQQLQQLSGEKSALQAENAKLKSELEQAKKELEKVSAGRTALENRARMAEATANRGQASEQQTQEQLEHARGQLQELIGKFRETAQTLRDVEGDRAAVKGQLSGKERELKTCVDRNAAFYNLNSEVLDRMDGRGFWSSIAEREPFTKLKRVELENLIEDYRYRADELRLEQEQRKQAQAAKQAGDRAP